MKKITMNISDKNLNKKERMIRMPKEKKQNNKGVVDITIKPKKKSKVKLIVWLVILGIILGGGGYLVYKFQGILKASNIQTSPTDLIGSVITQKEPELKKDENGLTNALLVGIDTRDTNPGLMNTDTIIVATLNPNTNAVTMLSIPRDMWVENPRYPGYFTKINAIYASCEIETPGQGMDCLSQVVEAMTGIKVQYYAMVNIQGLVNVIDMLGGVDINVDNAFTDYMFPTLDDSDYETVSFEAGLQHMDGVTAMRFARSRHSQSVEGSDYARARRQQKVIMAMKEKALSLGTLTNPVKVLDILTELGDSVKTSGITTEDIRAGINWASKIDKDHSYTMVLDPMAGNWSLIQSDSTEAFILVPTAGIGNWDNVKAFTSFYINNPGLCTENPVIYVYNGGLGYNEANAEYQALAAEYPFLSIVFGGNYTSDVTGTNIYSFSEPTKAASLEALLSRYGEDTNTVKPEGTTNPYGEDISIVFGAPAPAPSETPAEQPAQ